MKTLLVGSGAREHAIARVLKKTPIYNIGSHLNPGIAALAHEAIVLPLNDKAAIVAYAQEKSIELAIIGPEKPLELGLADALWQAGISVIGPTQALAKIESSKGYARDLMQEYQIPGIPRYQCFTQCTAETELFLKSLDGRYVVKADGLMSGKGVKVAGDHLHALEEALDFCHAIAGPFVIEEKLEGLEFSLLSFSDGKTLIHMPVVQDHKRLLIGDKGPNTGGMGTLTHANHRLPFLMDQEVQAAQQINEAVVAALYDKTGQAYRGILYGGFMKTAQGVKVIEYNARFGDPEAINLLGLLETDFLSICQAMVKGELHSLAVNFARQASVCKYLVPHAYPDSSLEKAELTVNQVVNKNALYYGSLAMENGKLLMQGSRALAVLCLGTELSVAEAAVEGVIADIRGDFYYRRDIGTCG